MQTLDSNEIARLLWQFCQDERIEFERFSYSLQQAYLPLLTNLYARSKTSQQQTPFIIGLNAPQGAGKSTLSRLLVLLFKECFGLNALHISIDDFYLTKKERLSLAQKIHPLLRTRGVPGTHDLNLALKTFSALKQASLQNPVSIPQFDKAEDDRCTEEKFVQVSQSPDIIIFEGWCVGSQAQPEELLQEDVNLLETDCDSDKSWRHYVNHQLLHYAELFKMIDCLVYLQAPDFSIVYEWRLEQEEKLRIRHDRSSFTRTFSNSPIAQIMDAEEIKHFIMFFERITRHNMKILPSKADVIISLNRYRSPKLTKQ